MEIQIKNPAELIEFVNRTDVSIQDAVTVCKTFFDAGGIPFDKVNTTKETVLNAIEKRLENGKKGFPIVFCNTI